VFRQLTGMSMSTVKCVSYPMALADVQTWSCGLDDMLEPPT